MTRKSLSTFEREMQNLSFREKFEVKYEEFLLSELICFLMKMEAKSVRQLAEETGLSPTVIQKMRSGKQEDVKLRNFISISHACGFHLVLEKGKKRIAL